MNLDALNTEHRNKSSMHIDEMSTFDILKTINQEDKNVPLIVAKSINDITMLVNAAFARLSNHGRIFYLGAGTSGRLGVLDASECPPTFGVSYDLFQGLIAGGDKALRFAIENAEDDTESAKYELQNLNLSKNDVVIGIAASGQTPYVIEGIKYAKSIGALTGSISCVKNAKVSKIVDYSIEAVTGPEVITGSSRMKAGTAQKLILNMISTTLMIKFGKVYENLMIDVQPTNNKLTHRAISIIKEIVKCSSKEAEELFISSNKNVKIAVMMGLTKADETTCKYELKKNNENTKRAIQYLCDQNKD